MCEEDPLYMFNNYHRLQRYQNKTLRVVEMNVKTWNSNQPVLCLIIFFKIKLETPGITCEIILGI